MFVSWQQNYSQLRWRRLHPLVVSCFACSCLHPHSCLIIVVVRTLLLAISTAVWIQIARRPNGKKPVISRELRNPGASKFLFDGKTISRTLKSTKRMSQYYIIDASHLESHDWRYQRWFLFVEQCLRPGWSWECLARFWFSPSFISRSPKKGTNSQNCQVYNTYYSCYNFFHCWGQATFRNNCQQWVLNPTNRGYL